MGIGLQEPQVGIRVMNLTRVFLRASELNRFYPGGVHAVGVSMLVTALYMYPLAGPGSVRRGAEV